MDSPEQHVTFASLPQADRERFEAWKGQVVKDCAWEQAFPSLAEQFPSPSGEAYVPNVRVDLRALLAGNAGSPLVAGPDGQLALFGTPSGDSQVVRRSQSQRKTVDGRVRVFEASSNREQGICVIALDGEELYRTALPATVPLIVATDAEALAAPGTDLAPLRDPVVADGPPVAASSVTPLLRHVLGALFPRRVPAFLASRFALSQAVVDQLFPLNGGRQPDVVRLLSTTATPFSAIGDLYGPRDDLQSIYAGGTVRIELLYRGLHDDLLAIQADLSVDAGGRNVRATAITAAPSVAFSDRAATDCFTARGVAARFEAAQPRRPAFTTQFAACKVLAADGFAALAADPSIRQTIAATALVPGSSTSGDYRGWDEAVINVAHRLDERGLPLTLLDPEATIPVLTNMVGRVTTLQTAISDLATRTAYGPALITLVFRWFFRSTAPTEAVFGDIRSALAKTATDYAASTETMLADLADSTAELGAGMVAVRCGLGLVGQRRVDVDHMLTAVATVPFGAAFAADQRDRVLQGCLGSAALVELEASIAATAAFVAEDQSRGGTRPAFEDAIEPLVVHALEQRWTATTFTALPDLLDLGLLNEPLCRSSNESRAEQIDCLDRPLTRFSSAPGRLLASAVVARNAALARELTARWSGLGVFIRLDVARAFFEGLWQGCADDGFGRSRRRLLDALDALAAATTIGERLAIEDQINALLQATTCA